MNKNETLLLQAREAWLAAEGLRRRRDRQKRYTYGDQWSDAALETDGYPYSEREILARKGRRPLTNNLIRQLVKTIVGRYRSLAGEAALYDTSPGSVDARNALPELDARMLEEFVISGCAIQRITAEQRPAGRGVWVDNVSPETFFVNDFRDPRGLDIDFVGMLHDMSLGEILNRFGRGRRERCEKLTKLYSTVSEADAFKALPASGYVPATDFYRARCGRMRVIEVWQLAATPGTDACGRHFMDMRWRCTWLAPDGSVLSTYLSPYRHGSHPFAVKFYPLTDGEVHSFVEDVIDQQRTVNRLVVLLDTMLAHSAKGALIFPLDQLPNGLSLDDVARRWAHPDAIIPVSGRGQEMPRQVMAGSNDGGAYRLLSLQMKLFEDISGIGDALLGRNIAGDTGAALYEARVRNASLTLTDLLETFTSFTADRTAKAHATI